LTGASASPALRFDSKKSGESLLPEQPAKQTKTAEQITKYCKKRRNTSIYKLPESLYVISLKEAKD
jgi:hypothetical protein